MSELLLSWMVLATEAALGLSVLLIIISMTVVLRHKRRINTAKTMTVQLISNVEHTQQELRHELDGSEEYEQLGLEDRIQELNKQQQRLYDCILAIYSEGKSSLLGAVSEDVKALLNASKALYKPSKRSLLKERVTDKALEEASLALKNENQELKQELQSVKQQMSQLKSEYTAVYERKR
jgi:hypothetical protein